MRKIGIYAVLSLMALALAAVPALADNPHFVSASGSVNATTGALTVSFKEAGLGDNLNIDYKLTADASATYVCVNNGGANPSASNKTTVSGPVEAKATFNSGKNGNVTKSLTAGPPPAPAPSSFSCPPGQTGPTLALVSYTNILLQDLTTPVSTTVADTSSGCLLPKVRKAC